MATILVIDDEPSVLRVLTVMLTTAGHTVHIASDGNQGLALFSQVNFRLEVITPIR